MEIRRILCPVDFSPTSRAAVDYAAGIAARFGASLTLLHVYHVAGYPLPEGVVLPSIDELDRLFAQINDALADWKRAAVGAGAGAVETESADGLPWQRIVERADEGRFDLVVMGTHGRTGIKHVLLGSVAEQVVRRAPCPVLTVRG